MFVHDDFLLVVVLTPSLNQCQPLAAKFKGACCSAAHRVGSPLPGEIDAWIEGVIEGVSICGCLCAASIF
eukprot:5267948-Amphidinium_carterae.1